MGSLGLVPHSLSPKNNGGAGAVRCSPPRQRSSPTRVVRCRRNGTRGAGLKGYNERSQNKSQIYGHYTCPCIPACPQPFSRPPLSSLRFPSPFLNVQFPTTKIKYLIRFLVASRVSLSSKYTCTHLREIEHDRTIGWNQLVWPNNRISLLLFLKSDHPSREIVNLDRLFFFYFWEGKRWMLLQNLRIFLFLLGSGRMAEMVMSNGGHECLASYDK